MDERLGQALLLGAVQGVTEWLPISSEGVLTLLQLHLFGKGVAESIAYALWLHLGTLLAVVAYFRRELVALLRALPRWARRRAACPPRERALLDFLALSTLATGAVGAPLLTLSLRVELWGAAATALIGLLLIATGLLQRAAPRAGKAGKAGRRALEEVTIWDAGIVGALQGLAALPGVSRSGVTIAGLLLRGFSETDALRLSFLMSLPVIAGAQVVVELLKLVRLGPEGARALWGAEALLGLGASAALGWLTIAALMRLARRWPFWAVAVALGVLSLASALTLLPS